MKRLVLLLACFQLAMPGAATANSNFGGPLATLKDIDDFLTEGELTQDDIEDEFDEEQPEDEEEDEENKGYGFDFDYGADPAVLQSGQYCTTPGVPYLWEAKAKKKKRSKKSAKKKKKRSGKKCACSSGCGMIQAGLKPTIKKFVAAAAKAGISPVSCIRTQACQNRLRSCYESCGQRGRAAKKSKHSDGKACDFSKKHASALTRVKKKTGLPIKRLNHGKEGGGLHEYQ